MTEDFVIVYGEYEPIIFELSVDKKGDITTPINDILEDIECYINEDRSNMDFNKLTIYRSFMKIEPPKDDYKLVKIKKEV